MEFEAEVVYVVGPDEQDDHDLTPYVARHAEGRYIIVCRLGGPQSWFDRVVAFVRREPIEAVTVIADESVAEDAHVHVTAEQTEMDGVYEASRVRIVGE